MPPNITPINPALKGLPEHLKDPANFPDIQSKILATLQSSCGHSELLDFAKCEKCTANMLKRRKLLKQLGFKNPAQYMEWRKTHEEIQRRFPLVDWKKKAFIANL